MKKNVKLTRLQISVSNVKLYDYCLRCGKKLVSFESRRLGYGNSCYKKVLRERIKRKDLL